MKNEKQETLEKTDAAMAELYKKVGGYVEKKEDTKESQK